MRFTDAELDAIRERHSCADIAGDWVKLRRRRGGRKGFTHVGPCPLCSKTADGKGETRFECNADKWVCAACGQGGNVFQLLMAREGVDFPTAVERLGGVRAETITPKAARRRGAGAFAAAFSRQTAVNGLLPRTPAPEEIARDPILLAAFEAGWDDGKRQAEASARYRERERKRLYENFWHPAVHWIGTPVEVYLRGRGLTASRGACLRFHPAMPYFADGRENEPRLIHTGPAMLAAIMSPNIKARPELPQTFYFSGLHITWLDPKGPKGKALITDPESGEILPSKKVRGSKAGGFIDLRFWPVQPITIDAVRRRMFAGEGIETVLAIFTALARTGRLRAFDVFRSAVDLGNLGGASIESVPHPTLKDKAGRTRRVPGPDPDLASPAMPVPDSVDELIGLGDGDSDAFTTQCAMRRFEMRNSRPGRIVRVTFAPPGCDFNDLIAGRAPPPGGNSAPESNAPPQAAPIDLPSPSYQGAHE